MTYQPIDNDDPLIAQVWLVMQDHKGARRRIDRDRLTFRLFGKVTDNLDRKVRDAIAELPIVWNNGYFIPTSYAEAQDYIASMRSRQTSIGLRLRILDQYLRTEREPIRVEQMSWMEV